MVLAAFYSPTSHLRPYTCEIVNLCSRQAFVQFRDVKSADKALERYAYEQPKGQYSHKYRDSSNASSKVRLPGITPGA